MNRRPIVQLPNLELNADEITFIPKDDDDELKVSFNRNTLIFGSGTNKKSPTEVEDFFV